MTIERRKKLEQLQEALITVSLDFDEKGYSWVLEERYLYLASVQELAGIIKLSSYNTFSLFEFRKAVAGSKAIDPVIGMVPLLSSPSFLV
jgi:hypothetical protein